MKEPNYITDELLTGQAERLYTLLKLADPSDAIAFVKLCDKLLEYMDEQRLSHIKFYSDLKGAKTNLDAAREHPDSIKESMCKEIGETILDINRESIKHRFSL